jgi:hypothetical protein
MTIYFSAKAEALVGGVFSKKSPTPPQKLYWVLSSSSKVKYKGYSPLDSY